MSSSLPVFSLNTLIRLNDQRLFHFMRVARQATESETKALFLESAAQAKVFKNNLEQWLMAYQGTPAHYTESWSDKMHYFISRYLVSDKRASLFADSELLEQNAVKFYEAALTVSNLPKATLEDLKIQTAGIQKNLALLRERKTNTHKEFQLAASA